MNGGEGGGGALVLFDLNTFNGYMIKGAQLYWIFKYFSSTYSWRGESFFAEGFCKGIWTLFLCEETHCQHFFTTSQLKWRISKIFLAVPKNLIKVEKFARSWNKYPRENWCVEFFLSEPKNFKFCSELENLFRFEKLDCVNVRYCLCLK